MDREEVSALHSEGDPGHPPDLRTIGYALT